jgi:hypothetical protein
MLRSSELSYLIFSTITSSDMKMKRIGVGLFSCRRKFFLNSILISANEATC